MQVFKAKTLKHLITSIISILIANAAIAQVTTIGFTIPDSVCVEAPFTPKNTSSGPINTYYWHFCSGNLNYAPSGTTLPTDANLQGPAFMAIAQDTGGYYALISNHGSPNIPSVPPSIVRYRFGKSLLNNPTSENLGNFGNIVPEHIEGIQIKQDNDGNWYGFITGGVGDDSKLIQLSFGKSLENTPIATDYGNFNKSLDYPVDFYLLESNGQWTGFTVNYAPTGNEGFITRFDFVNGLSQKPVATNITNIGLDHPCGICPYPQQNMMFVTNLGSSSITKLTFGNSYSSAPTKVESLPTSTTLDSPFDITILQDCNEMFGFTVNRYSNNLVRLDFPGGINGEVRYTNLGNVGNLYNPHGLTEVFRVDNEIFTFVANADNNTISRLYYQSCTVPSTITSNLKDPLPLYYGTVGNYNVSLIVDMGLPTEKTMCKNIVVMEKPELTLPDDKTICQNKAITLEPVGVQSPFSKYTWSTTDTTQKIIVPPGSKTDTVWLEVTNNKGCKDRDTVVISRYPDNLFLGNDTTLTLGEPIVIDAKSGYRSYNWSTGDSNTQSITAYKPGDYSITVTDTHGCTLRDTIHLTLNIVLPNFFTPNGDGTNDIWEPKLFIHYPEAEIKIFDRYGKLMASYRGNQLGWDGTYNGRPAEPDTYWYVVDLKNGIKPLTGQITIKR